MEYGRTDRSTQLTCLLKLEITSSSSNVYVAVFASWYAKDEEMVRPISSWGVVEVWSDWG
jgi:hypothetical protein